MFDDIPRPTCRSVSDKHLRHGGSGYETTGIVQLHNHLAYYGRSYCNHVRVTFMLT